MLSPGARTFVAILRTSCWLRSIGTFSRLNSTLSVVTRTSAQGSCHSAAARCVLMANNSRLGAGRQTRTLLTRVQRPLQQGAAKETREGRSKVPKTAETLDARPKPRRGSGSRGESIAAKGSGAEKPILPRVDGDICPPTHYEGPKPPQRPPPVTAVGDPSKICSDCGETHCETSALAPAREKIQEALTATNKLRDELQAKANLQQALSLAESIKAQVAANPLVIQAMGKADDLRKALQDPATWKYLAQSPLRLKRAIETNPKVLEAVAKVMEIRSNPTARNAVGMAIPMMLGSLATIVGVPVLVNLLGFTRQGLRKNSLAGYLNDVGLNGFGTVGVVALMVIGAGSGFAAMKNPANAALMGKILGGVAQEEPPQEEPEGSSSASNALKYGLAIGSGAAVAMVAAPLVVAGLGFGAGGIAAGSAAASMMSASATTGMGAGVVAGLQSVGAAGFSAAGYTTLAGAGGTAGGLLAKVWSGSKKEAPPDNPGNGNKDAQTPGDKAPPKKGCV